MNNSQAKNQEILVLTYITKQDNETIKIIGDESLDLNEFSYGGLEPNFEEEIHNSLISYYGNKNPVPFYPRESNKFELYDIESEKLIKDNKFTYKKKGEHQIKLVIKEKLGDISFMFQGCKNLKSIKGYIDVSENKNFTGVFNGCYELTDINDLKNWKVDKGDNFMWLFTGCESLEDISALKDWNVNNGIIFIAVFYGCSSLSNISPLENWNVSKGRTFLTMFSECQALKEVKALKNWDVSNGIIFAMMFSECPSLIDISPLIGWDISKGKSFFCMFDHTPFMYSSTLFKEWKKKNLNIKDMGSLCAIF